MSDPKVERKAPRFFGLPEDADDVTEGAHADVVAEPETQTEAPPPLGLTPPVEEPEEDHHAADAAEVLVDPQARREVGAIVEARQLRADVRAMLRRQRTGSTAAEPSDGEPSD